MKESNLILIICLFYNLAGSQTLQTITTSGNTTTNAIRITGENNIGVSSSPELVLGFLSTQRTNDVRNFIGWKNDAATNPTTNGLAGTLLLQSRSNYPDIPIDFVTGQGTPVLRMRIAGNGNVAIGNNTLTPTARLLISGAGNTNSTLSLLVQNSLGTQSLKVYDDGNVGIGTTASVAKEKVHIQDGSLLISGSTWGVNTVMGTLKVAWSGTTGAWAGIAGKTNSGGADQLDLLFYTAYGNPSEQMRIMSLTGYVGIGTSTPQAKLDVSGSIFCSNKLAIGTTDITKIGTNSLAVNGSAIFTKAKVAVYATAWPDYVFEPFYKVTTLDSLEHFIQLNKHLPEMPTAADVEKDGLDIGDTQVLLLKKIEELTLIVIEQNKRIEEQSQRIKNIEDGNRVSKTK